MSIQKTKSLLSPENIWHFHHPRLSSKIIIHPSSEEGTKSFVSSSFKETEGVRAKLNLLKMLLVVVSNHESIRRNNRWKKKREDEKSEGFTRVQKDLREWGGDDRRFSLNFSRGNVIGRRRCAEIERGYKLFKLSRAEKRPGSYHLDFGAGFRKPSEIHSLNLHAYRIGYSRRLVIFQ